MIRRTKKYNFRTFPALRVKRSDRNWEKDEQNQRIYKREVGLNKKWYLAVFTALSMGTNCITFQRACGGIAAWVQTFLRKDKNDTNGFKHVDPISDMPKFPRLAGSCQIIWVRENFEWRPTN